VRIGRVPAWQIPADAALWQNKIKPRINIVDL